MKNYYSLLILLLLTTGMFGQNNFYGGLTEFYRDNPRPVGTNEEIEHPDSFVSPGSTFCFNGRECTNRQPALFHRNTLRQRSGISYAHGIRFYDARRNELAF